MDIFGLENNVWTDSLMDRVCNGQSWFGQSPRWTGAQLDRVLFGNYIGTESLMDIFSNGQSLYWTEVDRVLDGQGYGWTELYLEITFGQSL